MHRDALEYSNLGIEDRRSQRGATLTQVGDRVAVKGRFLFRYSEVEVYHRVSASGAENGVLAEKAFRPQLGLKKKERVGQLGHHQTQTVNPRGAISQPRLSVICVRVNCIGFNF